MTENRKERGPARYYFTRGQLVLLASGFTLTSVIIFIMGIVIGQRIEENKLLKKNEPPLAQIPAQPLPPSSTEGPSAKNEMTFYDTLSQGTAKAKPMKKVGSSPAETQVTEAKAEEKSKQKEAARKIAPDTAPDKAEVSAETARHDWTVQVNAFPHERDAKELAKKLMDKGYDAYVVPVDVKGRPWYRVRVGHFARREEAKELQETIKTKENLSNAIAVSR
ncbi:MAG: SPOR domain-containing protein [Candidatus Binatia bacterium]